MLLVTILVALLPVSILGYHIYQSAWENSWREIREKHQLLAQNLAVPLQTYVIDHKGMLAILAENIPLLSSENKTTSAQLLQNSLQQMNGFRSLLYLDMQGRVIAQASQGIKLTKAQQDLFATEQCYLTTRKSGHWSMSKVKRHPVTRQPTIFMGQAVHAPNGKITGVVLGELRIDLIEDIRKKVQFGERGHSAIVDQTGHVIAHPNPEWMRAIKDISDWPIVQSMIAGETGATSFYSPFMKGNMVAGYAAVPGIGWGIMVPQPESEVAHNVNKLILSHLVWGAIGLVLAIVLALALSRWITGPLNTLASAGRGLMHSGLKGNLPSVRKNAPVEITQLGTVLRALISSLQASRDEVHKLNESLQEKVEEATQQLREANQRLEEAAQHDYLTDLANRRYFEESLNQALSRRSGDVEHVCVMLIDIDHFKQINDSYGHAAGDAVLNRVARILERGMRSGDLVARYGGDEFVAYMRCTRDIGMQRAEELHQLIAQASISWEDKNIYITASMGLYCQAIKPDVELSSILHNADDAMYKAKRQGRNRVVDISC
jgi:diguanylate cyclase (GGDEF)-like protein